MKEYYIPLIIIAAWVIFRLVVRQKQSHAYQCPHCRAEFQPSGWPGYLGPHLLFTKYLRCPKCQKWGWASLVEK